MPDEHHMSTRQWRRYLDELRGRTKEPPTGSSWEELRTLAHFNLELMDRVEELEHAVGVVERMLRRSR